MSNRGGSNDIWIMNADGSDPKRLTTDPGADDFCSIK
jgi:Tol biopolymer transport system component